MNLNDMLYFAPDEPVGGGATPPAPAAPEVHPTGPWDESLSRAFPDEATRGQVDQYLRSEIQPYITRKEQELGQVGEIWNALWDQEQTYPTYLELAGALYGDDVARKLAQTLAEHFEADGATPEAAAQAAVQAVGDHAAQQAAQPGAAEVPPVPNFDEWLQQVPPEFKQFVTSQMEREEDSTYNGQLDALQVQEPTIGANRKLFSRYVAAMEGDLNQAVELWREEMTPVITANPTMFGEDTAYAKFAAAQKPAVPARPAPTVLGGSTTAGGTTPPQIPAHQTIDEALDDFLVDYTKGRAGGAGSV